MSEHPSKVPTALPWSVQRRVDQACDQFEAAWQAGERLQIEHYVQNWVEPERSVLLRELIRLEIDHRRSCGEDLTPRDYQSRFPWLDLKWLVVVFAAAPAPGPGQSPASSDAASRESAVGSPAGSTRTKRVRCPHCHNPIQLRDEQPDEVLCPACGSTFRIRDTRQTSTTDEMRPLGKFQLMERVGMGAFGAVWRARDAEFDRIVALKIPHAALLSSPADLKRFYREARAAAQLRHPGIVSVHEVTTLDGLPAIVSEFVEGITLRELLQVRQPTFRESAELLAHVAEALDYAHSMGVVHRDVKPANIMLEVGSGFRVQGSAVRGSADAVGSLNPEPRTLNPRLLDFSLALREEAEITMTVDGQVLGTPAYMSP